jgi:hypothetical protein
VTNFCHHIENKFGVKKLVLYHYKNPQVAEEAKKSMQQKIGCDIELVHRLNNNRIVI